MMCDRPENRVTDRSGNVPVPSSRVASRLLRCHTGTEARPVCPHSMSPQPDRAGTTRAAGSDRPTTSLLDGARLSLSRPVGYYGFMEPHTKFRAAIRVSWLAVTVLFLGTAGYVCIEHVRWMDALYMTVITVTTIGFREVFPLSTAGRIFTMVLALSGVGVMLYAVSVVASLMVETDLSRLLGFRREHRMIDKITNHLVLCGAGRTGRTVIEILQARSAPLVVIERDAEQCRKLEQAGVLVVHGDATSQDVLLAAGVDRATTMISCLADDAHNVYTILLARRLNTNLKIIARAVGDASDEPLKLAGADTVINPYKTGAMRIAFTALKPTVVDFLDASLPGTNRNLELAEIRIEPGSRLAGQTLASANVRKTFGLIVVALKRGDESVFNPPTDTPMEPGDILVALGPTQSLEKLERASG